jgi:hypothetical protein
MGDSLSLLSATVRHASSVMEACSEEANRMVTGTGLPLPRRIAREHETALTGTPFVRRCAQGLELARQRASGHESLFSGRPPSCDALRPTLSPSLAWTPLPRLRTPPSCGSARPRPDDPRPMPLKRASSRRRFPPTLRSRHVAQTPTSP